MLQAKNIQKSYGTLTVLSDISFSLAKGQKAALVGANGTGKTTLLKILANLEESDGGSIECTAGMQIGYLPQDTIPLGEQTIRSYLQSVSSTLPKVGDKFDTKVFDHRATMTLMGFGLDTISLDRTISSLSCGQKTKIGLALLLLKNPDLILLDEPTNNLDIPALIWLEKYLKNSPAACIIVSHDRKFLDRITDMVFDLDKQTHSLKVESGNYTNFLERKLKALKRQKEMYEHQQSEIKRLNIEARKRRGRAIKGDRKEPTDSDKFLKGFKSDRVGQKLTNTAKILEEKVERMGKIEKVDEPVPLRIDLEAENSGGKADIELTKMLLQYKNGFELGPVSLQINYGKRFGFIGLNGSGKTTLLKIISGDLIPDSGEIKIGSAVRIGNLTQEHANLPMNDVACDFFSKKSKLDTQFVYNILGKFGLSKKNIRGNIGELSPGGRARFLLALFSVRSVNTLILDEPTNHLDIEAVAALEEILSSYKGTIILVSHDRYFLEKSRLDFIYLLENGKIERIPELKPYIESAEEKAQKLLKNFN